MLLSNFPGLTPAINSFVCRVRTTASFGTGKDRGNSLPEESPVKLHVPICCGTSAKELLWKKPLCSTCFLTSSFSGCPCSFHANIIYFWKGLINIKVCTPVTEQEHLHRASLQKWPFHFTFTLESEITSKCEKPSFNLSYRPIHKTILFCGLHVIFPLHLKPHLSCPLVWVNVCQDTENEWRKWWVLIFKMVLGCTRAGP